MTVYFNLIVSTLFWLVLRTDAGFQKFELSAYPYARCLDSTVATYYADFATSEYWVIYFAGGTGCRSSEECTALKGSTFGSSKDLPDTIDESSIIETMTDIFYSDPMVNPDFSRANRVVVPYCSGDMWLGTGTDQLSDPEWPFQFSGHHILDAVINDLSSHGLATPWNKVIVAGRSAGGIGILNHLDYIASVLPSVEVRGYINAGFFIDFKSFDQFVESPVPTQFVNPINEQLHQFSELVSAFYDAGCKASLSASIPTFGASYCSNAHAVLPFIETPVFFAQAFYDTEQIFQLNRAPMDSDGPAVQQYIESFGADLRTRLGSINPKHGYMGVSCRAHGVNWNTVFHQASKLTLQQTFSAWYFNNGLPSRNLDPVPDLNPSCDSGDARTNTHGCHGRSLKFKPEFQISVDTDQFPIFRTLLNPGIFSLVAWVRFDDYNGVGHIVNYYDGSPERYGFSLSAGGSSGYSDYRYVFFKVKTPVRAIGFSIPSDYHGWAFVCVRYDPVNVMFRVGDFDADIPELNLGPITNKLDSFDPLQIAYIPPESLFQGALYELGLWHRALTVDEFQKARFGYANLIDPFKRIVLGYAVSNGLLEQIRTDNSALIFRRDGVEFDDEDVAIQVGERRCLEGPGMKKRSLSSQNVSKVAG